ANLQGTSLSVALTRSQGSDRCPFRCPRWPAPETELREESLLLRCRAWRGRSVSSAYRGAPVQGPALLSRVRDCKTPRRDRTCSAQGTRSRGCSESAQIPGGPIPARSL